MKKISIKLIIVLTAVASLFFISTVYAAEASRMLQAWFGVKIVYNNQEISTSTVQPFIVDGTTYVPLRLVTTSFNKDISWDAAANQVTIVDKPNTTEVALRNEIIVKDATIAKLRADLDKAKAGDDDDDDDDTDLDDLEDNLNDDYGDYKSKDIEISLSGDEDDIDVVVEISSSDWSALSSTYKTTLLENICADIRDEYDDAEIIGYVKSSSGSTKYAYFYYNTGNKISMNSNKDIIDLEKELNDDYSDYFEDEDVPLYITLGGTTSSPKFYINIDYHKYDDEWDDIDDDDVEELMSNIFEDIQDEFDCDDDDIDGYVYDTYDDDEIASYYKSSSGTVNFDRD